MRRYPKHSSSAIADVIAHTCDHFWLQLDDFYGPGKRGGRRTSNARACVMWALRAFGWSYPEIARELGGFDHTSVIYACRNVQRDAELSRAAEDCARLLDRLKHPATATAA